MRTLFLMFFLSLIMSIGAKVQAQTEYTAVVHFEPSFNYAANFNHANVTFYCSMNYGTDINLLRSALLVQPGISNVTINPHTPTTYAVSITFKTPVNIRQTYKYFKHAKITHFVCPTGTFHLKDFQGWIHDQIGGE